MMDAKQVKNIVEACLLVAGKAMSLRQLYDLFDGDDNRPDKETIKSCIEELQADCEGRGIELVQVASGYRLQSRAEVSDWVARLFPEKPPRYSRALLETLVLVAYRQPITRGEIEEIRGVAVSSNIVKTLQERQWVKDVGFKDVPGKPALLGTTKSFLDYFNLKRLDDLPPLSEIKDLDEMDKVLMDAAGISPVVGPEAANDGDSEGDYEDVQEEQTSYPTNEADTRGEKTVFAAGEAVSEGPNSEAIDDDEHDALADHPEQVVAQDEDAPVTFAGLLSSLPSLDDTHSENTAAAVEAGDESVENRQMAENNIYKAETAAEQPGAEEKLLATVSEFADEHKKEIEVRDELESQSKTRYIEGASEKDVEGKDSELEFAEVSKDAEPVEADNEDELTKEVLAAEALGDAIDASSTSPEALSDTFTGDSLGVGSSGETLH